MRTDESHGSRRSNPLSLQSTKSLDFLPQNPAAWCLGTAISTLYYEMPIKEGAHVWLEERRHAAPRPSALELGPLNHRYLCSERIKQRSFRIAVATYIMVLGIGGVVLPRGFEETCKATPKDSPITLRMFGPSFRIEAVSPPTRAKVMERDREVPGGMLL